MFYVLDIESYATHMNRWFFRIKNHMVKRIVIIAKKQDSYFFLWVKCTPDKKHRLTWTQKNRHVYKRETDRKTAQREGWLDLFTVLTKYPFPSFITSKFTYSIWFIAVFAVCLTSLWTVLSIQIGRTSWNDKYTEFWQMLCISKAKKKKKKKTWNISVF